MRFISTPASVRLIGGFVIVLAIFAVAARQSMRNMERIVEATDRVRELQSGKEEGMKVESLARRMDAAMADLAGGGDLQQVEVFRQAAQDMKLAREGIGRFATAGPETKLVVECNALSRQLDADFDQYLVPAVIQGEEDAAWDNRQICSDTLEKLIGLNEQLTRSQERKIEEARASAYHVRVAAVRDTGLLLSTAVLSAMVIALLIARSISAPIKQLMDATQAVARGDLTRKLDTDRNDEFGRLAESFNRMSADLRENQQRLIQAEKMASLGRLASGIAHEINNPIGVISGYADLLAREKGLSASVGEGVRIIREESRLCQRIVQELLTFARPAPIAEEIIDMRAVVEEVLDRTRRSALGSRVEVATEFSADRLPVRVDRGRLRLAVENIMRNGVEAMSAESPEGSEGGTMKVTLRVAWQTVPTDAGGMGSRPMAEAVFQDSGPGIPAEYLERLFEPFFSTKEKGTGLGLSIAYAAVRAYDGNITVQSAPGKGATFTVRIPLADGEEPK